MIASCSISDFDSKVLNQNVRSGHDGTRSPEPNLDFVCSFRTSESKNDCRCIRDHRRHRSLFQTSKFAVQTLARPTSSAQSDRSLIVLVRMRLAMIFCPKDIISLYHLANNHTACCVSFGVSQAKFQLVKPSLPARDLCGVLQMRPHASTRKRPAGWTRSSESEVQSLNLRLSQPPIIRTGASNHSEAH